MRLALALVLVVAWAASGACIAANTLEGRVVSVADGDTLTVLDAQKRPYRVRLAGIDAPEHAQPWGAASRQVLAARVLHRDVVVRWSKLDRYDRVVGTVFLEGIDINRSQVADGMAWHYTQYAREQSAADAKAYRMAEDWARKRGLGLWADPAPIPPWKFRHE